MNNIILLKDGPIIISNEVSKLALCRCGQSEQKPICDGSHKGCELPEGEIKVKAEHLSVASV
jgi:CDGSH-type Zn-finger protein